MTDSLPGWYVDPSGLPDTFRWWDGRQWTQALTTDPSAPAPTDPAPVVPHSEHPDKTPDPFPAEPSFGPYGRQPSQQYGQQYGQPPFGGQQHTSQFSAVPPPPGAPGPGYMPPPFDPMTSRTEVLGADPEPRGPEHGVRRGLLYGGIGGAILLVLVMLGGYLVFFSDDEPNPAASGANTPASTPSNEPKPTPEPRPTPKNTPDDQQPKPNPQGAKLEYQPLQRPWGENQSVTDATFGELTGAYGQARVTEPNYKGDTDWVAMVGVGPARREWVSTDDSGSAALLGTAEQAAKWFSEHSFGDASVQREPPDAEPLEVSGQQGVLLKQHVSYDIPNLKSEGETVYVAVVDLGEGAPPGVFVASVPDTDEKLLDDVDEAVASLRISS